MSVFKRGGAGKYYIQFNYNGKTYCRSSKTTNKRTAERMEREWKDEIHRSEELGASGSGLAKPHMHDCKTWP